MGGGNSVSARIEPATTDRPAAGVFTTMPQHPVDGRKPGTLRPQKPLRLIRDGEVGGSGFFLFYFISNTYSLHLSLIHI